MDFKSDLLKCLNESKNNTFFRTFSNENFESFKITLDYDIRRNLQRVLSNDNSEWLVMEEDGKPTAIANTTRNSDFNDLKINFLFQLSTRSGKKLLKSIINQRNISIFWLECKNDIDLEFYRNPDFKMKEIISDEGKHFFYKKAGITKSDFAEFSEENF